MAYKQHIHLECKQLYLLNGKSLEEISRIMSIPLKTLQRWRLKEKWDDEIKATSQINIINKLKDKVMKKIDEACKDDSITNPKVADSILKSLTTIEKLMPRKLLLDNIFKMLESLSKYFQEELNDDKFRERWAELLPEISDFLRKEFGDDNA